MQEMEFLLDISDVDATTLPIASLPKTSLSVALSVL